MKNDQLLRCIFPDVLADYFDVVDIQESVSQFDFWLDERNFMEKSDHKLGTVSSYGFTSERVIQDFPLHGKAVYLHVRRRKWRDSSNGEYLLIHMMIWRLRAVDYPPSSFLF